MKMWRRGASRNLTVTVGEMSTERAANDGSRAGRAPVKPRPVPSNWLGVVASALGDEQRSELRVKVGVVVEAVEEKGPAGRPASAPAT